LWESEKAFDDFARLEDGELLMASPVLAETLISTMALSGDHYAVRAKVHSIEQGAIFLGFITPDDMTNARSGLMSTGRVFGDANVGGVFERFLHSYPGTINAAVQNELLFTREGDLFRLYVN